MKLCHDQPSATSLAEFHYCQHEVLQRRALLHLLVVYPPIDILICR